MKPRREVPLELAELAAEHAGVVTREQALASGLTRHVVSRLVTNGSWRRLAPGLYLTVPIEPPWLAWAWGGVLLGGEDCRLGGRAAAYLHGLVETAPERIAVLVPNAGGRPRVAGPWSFRRRERPSARLPLTVGSPPQLGAEDVVLDLAAAEQDPRAVIGLVTAAVQSRQTTTARLRIAMQARFFVPQRALLSRLLEDVAVGAQSPLELDYLRDVERAHGLPVGRRQASQRRTEVDVWYEKYGLLVELDGKTGHEGIGRFRDMRRDNASTTQGLATLRYGSFDVRGTPCAVAAQVADNLHLRGWEGPFLRCSRCRAAA